MKNKMKPAVITFKKEYLVNEDAKDQRKEFLEIYNKMCTIWHDNDLINYSDIDVAEQVRIREGYKERFRRYLDEILESEPALIDNSEKHQFVFKNVDFDILEFSFVTPELNKVVISLHTEEFTIIDNFDSSLIVARGNKSEEITNKISVDSIFFLKLPPSVTFGSYRPIL